MADTTFPARQRVDSAEPLRISARALSGTLAAFALISFVLCMLLGAIVPDAGLHRPWLQFYLGLTGFDLRSLALGGVQSTIFGGYAGAMIAFLFNLINRRLG